MQHPLCNKKDFDQALTELGITNKDFIARPTVSVSYEWLRRVLTEDASSPRLEREIVKIVKKGEKARAVRHQKRQLQLNEYKNAL